MSKLYVPEIGDEIKLSKEWKFNIYNEYRNEALLTHLSLNNQKIERGGSTEIIIPKDSILKIDRIYIRKGSSDFSSITFYVKYPGSKNKYRFWAKLSDCNNIEFEHFNSFNYANKKLWYNCINFKIGDFYSIYADNKEDKIVRDSEIYLIKATDREKLYDVEIEIGLRFERQENRIFGMLRSVHYHAYIKSLNYKVLNLDKSLVGNWTTITKLKTQIKKLVNGN